MVGAIIGLILLCIILGVVFWGGKQLLALVPMDPVFATIVNVLFVLLSVCVVIYVFIIILGFAGIHVPTMWH